MYFLWRYFLSSVPSVNMFPLFTIVKITTVTCAKWRKINLMVSRHKLLSRVLFPLFNIFFNFILKLAVKCSVTHCRLFFIPGTCFYPWSLYVLNIFPKWLKSWNKALFPTKDKSVRTISIFSHTTIVDTIHFLWR